MGLKQEQPKQERSKKEQSKQERPRSRSRSGKRNNGPSRSLRKKDVRTRSFRRKDARSKSIRRKDGRSRSSRSRKGRSKSGRKKSGRSRSGPRKHDRSKSGRRKNERSRSGRRKCNRSRSGRSRADQAKKDDIRNGKKTTGRSRSCRSKSGQSRNDRSKSNEKKIVQNEHPKEERPKKERPKLWDVMDVPAQVEEEEPPATIVAGAGVAEARSQECAEMPVAPPSPPSALESALFGVDSQRKIADDIFGRGSGVVAGLPSAAFVGTFDRKTAQKKEASSPSARAVASSKGQARELGIIRWYNGRRKLGKLIPDSGGEDLFIPARGAPNGSQVPPQPGGLFHGTRVSFVRKELAGSEVGDGVEGSSTETRKSEVVCMDVKPVPGQVGLSCGVHTDIGGQEVHSGRVAANDLHELGFISGVFDGHRGGDCANFVAQNLPTAILSEYRKRVKREGGIASLSMQQEVAMISESLVDAFASVDTAYLEIARKKGLTDGSTAAIALVCHGFEDPRYASRIEPAAPEAIQGTVPAAPGGVAKLFVAWCGDSRAVLLRGKQGVRCSVDHRAARTDEQERVQSAGGRVMRDALGIQRVGPREDSQMWRELTKSSKSEPSVMKWCVSTTRSFGDAEFKAPGPIIISTPEVKVINLLPEDWAVVLACDGVFDSLSDQEVADIVWKTMASHGLDAVEASKAVVEAAKRCGSRDNLTAVVMHLGWSTIGSSTVAPPTKPRPDQEAPTTYVLGQQVEMESQTWKRWVRGTVVDILQDGAVKIRYHIDKIVPVATQAKTVRPAGSIATAD